MPTSNNIDKVTNFIKIICKILIILGNSLTLIGCLGIILGLGGIIRLDDFAVGISSGIRVIGTVAIAGCLLSAIGYGFSDYID